MSYKFKFTDNVYILNFSEEYAKTPVELVESEAFENFMLRYITFSKTKDQQIYTYLSKAAMDDDLALLQDILKIAKLLLVMDAEELQENYKNLRSYFEDKDMLYKFIESVYLFWRRHERYCLIMNKHELNSLEDISFLEAQTNFQTLILETYRQYEYSLGFKNLVYRQIIAGVNAGLVLNTSKTKLPLEYSALENIPMITQINIHPPFITHSKSYKREGIFKEAHINPIHLKKFNTDEWFCYPAMAGDLLIYVYFNIAFMSQGVSICNLFKMADMSQIKEKKPDLIYVCGYDDNKQQQCFFQDNINKIMFGYISLDDKFDYFGYMKKMILTLHNVKKINAGRLPIHGAMVEITFANKQKKRLIIVGDSGAGKSETIEQIKTLGANDIIDIKTIYDDMGVLYKDKDECLVSSGTEIGAFVRLNDLEAGYGYKELDRSVIMNPDQANARIVTPTTLWKEVVEPYKIDYFLYANNYENSKNLVEFFKKQDDALAVFKQGRRMSKNTTNESGITESFFANPFGPTQRKKQTDKLLKDYFKCLFDQKIKVGQVYTKLGIEGYEHKGPKQAAEQLLNILREK